jgi:hypothetical protein
LVLTPSVVLPSPQNWKRGKDGRWLDPEETTTTTTATTTTNTDKKNNKFKSIIPQLEPDKKPFEDLKKVSFPMLQSCIRSNGMNY